MLDQKIRGLIAVGASVTANCRPCLRYHAGRASGLGASAGEIAEAVEVGRMVRAGAASGFDRAVSIPAEPLRAPGNGSPAEACCGRKLIRRPAGTEGEP